MLNAKLGFGIVDGPSLQPSPDDDFGTYIGPKHTKMVGKAWDTFPEAFPTIFMGFRPILWVLASSKVGSALTKKCSSFDIFFQCNTAKTSNIRLNGRLDNILYVILMMLM